MVSKLLTTLAVVIILGSFIAIASYTLKAYVHGDKVEVCTTQTQIPRSDCLGLVQ